MASFQLLALVWNGIAENELVWATFEYRAQISSFLTQAYSELWPLGFIKLCNTEIALWAPDLVHQCKARQ